jgi:cellulose synthase (UDP-forming)
MNETARVRQARWQGVPHSSLTSRLIDIVCGVIGLILLVAVATVPLDPRQQAILAVTSGIVFLIANRFKNRSVSVFLVMLSLAVSLRYIFWRVTETLDFGSIFELLLGIGLAIAETYAILVLVLGYVQTLWPLERKPIPMPEDFTLWPTVDVYIPTYNEPMSIVRATVLGCIAMDWPPEKMRVYLLDDGRREEFREFAAECGIGYITRNDNLHAKAGNLNNAMRQTDGEFIAVFDSDHIPTRAFLQMTMGWMIAEPRNALVQTPHHFYSPDPFQRNLAAGTRVPAEGNMFYGLVQDANDYWNSTFFCGSCAVLRRAALEEIGGFAVETVTEDAHTMLKMHRRGWDSCYLRLPLAAGLATERLILHIGQRVRWARGMIQIFRLDNPLFGPGLTLGQRICYLQAMGHFFFAVPRVIFLTAPLAFLLFGMNIIAASPLAIVSYALPHIFHSVATNSRLQRNNRHSFWSEIYETVLALFLVRVTAVTLFAPRRGKFNVTNKGGLLENGYFDLGAVYPNLILAFFLVAGVIRGLVSMVFFQTEQLTFQALLLNTIWGFFSLLTVMAALAVGRETRQMRSRARVRATVPVSIYLPDGRAVSGITQDLSQGGSSVVAERPMGVTDGALVQFEFLIGGEAVVIPARLLRWDQRFLQASFQPASIADEAAIVQAVFGRADAWTDWSAYPVDRPMASLYRVLISIRGLFRPPDRAPTRPTGGGPVAPGRRQLVGTAAAIALMLVPAAAHTQTLAQNTPPAAGTVSPGATNGGGFVIRPIPGAAPSLNPASAQPRAPGLLGVPPSAPAGVPPAQTVSAPPPGAVPAPGLPAPAPVVTSTQPAPPLPPGSDTASGVPAAVASATPFVPASDAAKTQTRQLVLTIHQLGALGPLTLRGTSELQGVQFGIRADEVVTGATLNLSGAMSPALIPEFSNVTVTLNEQYVGTIPVNRDQPRFENFELPVSPVFFQDNNRLNFRFTGRYTPECNDPLSGLLWSTISDTSTLTLTLERLPPQRDLSRLPLPFFDPHEKTPLALPFIMPGNPSNESLQAAGIVSSWFGQLADFRGASFPVVSDAPSEGNAVMVVTGSDRPAGITLPPLNGPTLAVVPNPNDPTSSLLVIAGRTGAETVAAATSLTLGSRTLSGDASTVVVPDVPKRVAYDAPAWIPSERAVKFGELVDASELQGTGYVPGTMRVPFRTAPDLYTWRNRPFPMELRYRAPPGPIEDLAVSRLDVGINDLYLASLPLASEPSRNASWFSRLFNFGAGTPTSRVDVPSYEVFGQNDLQFFFDTRPLHRGDCVAIPQDVRMAVDPDSTFDISRAYRFAQLPNLAYFVSSGFPFTRMADMSETAVVLPAQPAPVEVSAYLDMMGRIGSLTGYPVIRLAVVKPDGINSVGDRNLLLMGTLSRLGPAADLLKNSPYRVNGNRLSVDLSTGLESVRRLFGDPQRADRDRAATVLNAGFTPDTAALVGAQSPLNSSRSVVAVLGGAPAAIEGLVTTLRDPDQAPLIQGDLALLGGGRFTSYRVGSEYTVGALPFWLYPSWLLRDQPLGIVGVMIIGCILVAIFYFFALRRRAALRTRRIPTRRL